MLRDIQGMLNLNSDRGKKLGDKRVFEIDGENQHFWNEDVVTILENFLGLGIWQNALHKHNSKFQVIPGSQLMSADITYGYTKFPLGKMWIWIYQGVDLEH